MDQFPSLFGRNKSHQLNAAINCIMLVGAGMQGEPNKTESQAMFSARLFCKQAIFFSLKTPTSDNAVYHVTSPTTYSVSWLPIFLSLPPSRPLHPKLPPDSSRRVGWPIKHSHSKQARLAAHSEVEIQQQSLLHLLCLPRESQGGNFWRRHILKNKKLCEACKEPPEHVSHRPTSARNRSHQQRCRPSVARAITCTCKL